MTFDSKKVFPFDHQRMAVALVDERSDDFLTTRLILVSISPPLPPRNIRQWGESHQASETCIATRYRSELPSSIEHDMPDRKLVLELVIVRD